MQQYYDMKERSLCVIQFNSIRYSKPLFNEVPGITNSVLRPNCKMC